MRREGVGDFSHGDHTPDERLLDIVGREKSIGGQVAEVPSLLGGQEAVSLERVDPPRLRDDEESLPPPELLDCQRERLHRSLLVGGVSATERA